jgi:AraC-like DNA-binding protein
MDFLCAVFLQNGTVKSEQAMFWLPPALPGVEALSARFVNHRFARHAHAGLVLAAMEEGGEAFECRGTRHVAPPGSLVVVEPETAHTGESASGKPWSYCAVYVDRAWFPAGVPRFASPVIQDPGLFARFRSFHHHLRKPHEILWAETEFIGLLEHLGLRHGSGLRAEREVPTHASGLSRVKDYLEAHFRESVRLQDLAVIAGLGKFHLLRIFKTRTGFSPYEFLVQLRVRQAMELLRQGMAATTAAFETGFADQAHLNRHFKRLVGVTPGAFARAGQHRSSGRAS